MRSSFLRAKLEEAGATFTTRAEAEVAMQVADPAAEYRFVREAAGLTDFSAVRVFRIPEEPGVDLLERLVAGNVARLRFGRVLHTFLANEEGSIVADCYVANNDQELLWLVEAIAPDAALDEWLAGAGAGEAGLEELTGNHALLGVDGYRAWEVVRDLFGSDVLGLPYLSIETYALDGASVRLLRAGKTSEFGYLLSVPAAAVEGVFVRLRDGVTRVGGGLCGVGIHDELRLEGRFFNVQAEGRRVGDPLVLGLQWMIDFDKEQWQGRDSVLRRRAAGVARKVLGLALAPGEPRPAIGTALYHAGNAIGEVVATANSPMLGCALALGVVPAGLAYSGLEFQLGATVGPGVHSISMPPIMPRSLTVKLDEM